MGTGARDFWWQPKKTFFCCCCCCCCGEKGFCVLSRCWEFLRFLWLDCFVAKCLRNTKMIPFPPKNSDPEIYFYGPGEFFRHLSWPPYVLVRGPEKWTQSTLMAVMKNPILTHLLSFSTVIYTEIPSFVSVSPGAAPLSQHTPILSNTSTTHHSLPPSPAHLFFFAPAEAHLWCWYKIFLNIWQELVSQRLCVQGTHLFRCSSDTRRPVGMRIPTFWVMSGKLDGLKVNEWELVYDLDLLSLWLNHSWPLLTADSLWQRE